MQVFNENIYLNNCFGACSKIVFKLLKNLCSTYFNYILLPWNLRNHSKPRNKKVL